MNYKLFSSEGENISDQKYTNKIKLKKYSNIQQLKNFYTTKTNIAHSRSYQHQELGWFWSKHSHWSNFRRGLFWGITVTSTAILSAGFGAALTTIDVVEEAIAKNILPQVDIKHSANASALDRPLNVLLIEVKPDSQNLIKFELGEKSKSKKILVLKFDPQIGLARIINIPLDSRVRLPGAGWGTIADAHQSGGIALTTQMVEQLIDNVKIDRHLQATPQIYERLAASGMLNLKSCDSRLRDCESTSKQIEIQEKDFETIRQRLNIPAYLSNFQEAIDEVRPNLDSNISVQEFMAIANFVKTLDRNNLSVNFLPKYTPGEMLTVDHNRVSPSPPPNTLKSKFDHLSTDEYFSNRASSEKENLSIKSHPIAVENTTGNLELGTKVVNYLRSQNFQDVYLVGHTSLELKQTEIIAGVGQLKSASHLKEILGIGSLYHNTNNLNRALTVRIGSDANHLTEKIIYNY